MQLSLYFVKEKLMSKKLQVQLVPSFDQVADILSKASSTTHSGRLKNRLSVVTLAALSLRGSIEVGNESANMYR